MSASDLLERKKDGWKSELMVNHYSHYTIQPLQILDGPIIWSGAVREYRCNFFTKLSLDIGVGSNEVESLVKEVKKQEERKEERHRPKPNR